MKLTRNPWTSSRSGGSSGGSAAAVAQDAAFALAAILAVYSATTAPGVVGFKPPMVGSRDSVFVAFASSLDQIGPLTKLFGTPRSS
jgi:Asp-tRNA(Asn)/Glu-tRNA(Gln) amidotransferase A subunit family amidase